MKSNARLSIPQKPQIPQLRTLQSRNFFLFRNPLPLGGLRCRLEKRLETSCGVEAYKQRFQHSLTEFSPTPPKGGGRVESLKD